MSGHATVQVIDQIIKSISGGIIASIITSPKVIHSAIYLILGSSK